jgi:hypothetical protein
MPDGQPSMIPPTATPWDSPKVLNLKIVPKVFPAIPAKVMIIACFGLVIGVKNP